MRLRFSLHFSDLNLRCACGKDNDVNHALSCAKGGYTIMRHDRVRDTVAEILSYAGVKGVEIERLLQPCDEFTNQLKHWNNTAPDARMDVVGTGLWQPDQQVFLDVRVIHPNSASYISKEPANLYREHEQRKKRDYLRRVQLVEGGAFVPLITSTTGGLGEQFQAVLKRTAALIEQRHGEPYAETVSTLKQRIRFSVLRSTLRSLRGCRHPIKVQTLGEFDFNL